MAISFQERGRAQGRKTDRVTATVRRDGVSVSATFGTKKQAKVWAAATQIEVERCTELGVPFDKEKVRRRGRQKTLKEIHADLDQLAFARDPDSDPTPRRDWTLGRALEHYHATVTPTNKGALAEGNRIKAWRRHALAAKPMEEVTRDDLQLQVNERLEEGRAAMTVRNDIFVLSALYRHAAGELPSPSSRCPSSPWGLTGLANPVAKLKLPRPPKHRDRRLQDGLDEGDPGEEECMREALRVGPHGDVMISLFSLAIETAMRLSELLSVRPSMLRSTKGVRSVELPDSKNGDARHVVLSTRGWQAIETLVRGARASDSPIFPLKVDAVEYRWAKARSVGGIQGLTFHDLRHEGLSRMAEFGLHFGELQAQGGQKTAAVTARYLNSRASEISRKLG